jgi:hypothetical protein
VSVCVLQLHQKESCLKEDQVRIENEVSKVKHSQSVILQSLQRNEEEERDSSERRQLVTLIDQIKKEKTFFKKSCREEKALLEQEIERLRQHQDSKTKKETEEEESLLQQEVEKHKERLKRVTLELAHVSRDVLRCQRRLDDIPSRSEVTQYQRRFVELYDQIAAKHIEAKKFYVLFNQLEDTRLQLDKEFTLLNSIMESFSVASQSVNGQADFLAQFESIIHNLVQARSRIESRISQEKDKKDQLNRQLQDYLEKQRLYNKLIDKFKKECTKSQVLQDELNQEKQSSVV